MKSILLFLFTLACFTSFSQDLTKLLGLFDKASLPYALPQEASVGFGDEEEGAESKYKSIDVVLFNSVTEAGVDEQNSLEAVAKLEFPNFYILIIADTYMNVNNGMIHRSLVYYTVDKKGQMIDMRYAQQSSMHDNFEVFELTKSDTKMAMGEYEGEEDLIIVEKTTTTRRNGTQGMHNESQTITSTTYDSIDASGKISDVTTYLDK